MYSLPQEIEVWYIIPAIRRELAKFLIQKGLKQNKVAEILGTTEAAISQYLHKKRAQEIKFPKEMKKEFEIAARIMIKDNNKAVSEILRLLALVKQKGISCCVCKKHNRGILHICLGKPIMEVAR